MSQPNVYYHAVYYHAMKSAGAGLSLTLILLILAVGVVLPAGMLTLKRRAGGR